MRCTKMLLVCAVLGLGTQAVAQSRPRLEILTKQGDYYWVVETAPDGARRGGWVGVGVPLDSIDRDALKPLPATAAIDAPTQAPPEPLTLDERLARIEQALATGPGATVSSAPVQPAPAPTRAAARPQIAQPGPQSFRPATPYTRGSLVGVVGTTFISESGPLFGLEVEGRPSRHVGFYGSVGRMQNGLPTVMQDAMDLVALITGVPVDLRLPTTYGTGGVRIIAPAGGVEAYGLAGAGFAYMQATASVAGVTLPTELLEDLSGADLSAVKPMIEFGGGVGIPMGRLRIDLGYRFGKPLNMGVSTNWSRAQVGVGVGF